MGAIYRRRDRISKRQFRLNSIAHLQEMVDYWSPFYLSGTITLQEFTDRIAQTLKDMLHEEEVKISTH